MSLWKTGNKKTLPDTPKRKAKKSAVYNYPEADRDDSVVDDYFGTKVPDAYRWLEDLKSFKTKYYIASQNSLTNAFLKKCIFRQRIKNLLTSEWNYPKHLTPFRRGEKYYQYRNSGLQNHHVLYVSDGLESEPSVFINPNELSKDGSVSLAGVWFSKNGLICAYAVSTAGSDWLEVRFMHVNSRETYDDVLEKVKHTTICFTYDDKGLFYSAYLGQVEKPGEPESIRNQRQKIYYHKLGTNQSEDIAVVEFEEPGLRIASMVSYCGKYILVLPRMDTTTNLVYYAHVRPIKGKLLLQPVITKFIADFTYITNNENKFIFLTNRKAPNNYLVIIDIFNSNEKKWTPLIRENTRSVLEWAKPVDKNKLVLCYLKDVRHVLQINNMETGEKIYEFKLDSGTITGCSTKRKQNEMFYSFSSFLIPGVIHRVEFTAEGIKDTIIYQTKVRKKFSLNSYTVRQVFYKSKDGTHIPMFIIKKKDSSGPITKPCLLFAYGGFKASTTPIFALSRLIFVKHFDGIVAIANVRGGGEYGTNWYHKGICGCKQNSFDDFQYAAKYLINEKYTSSEKLVIQGISNGGLLVAASINQSPHLFGAAICQVGVLDMLRFHKFTIGFAWTNEYGNPEKADHFRFLYKYSPLHNVQKPKNGGQYPATLVITADHDDRVVPSHSLKFIAELQHKIGRNPAQHKPLMIKVEAKVGHGIGKSTSKKIDEITDIFCFISNVLNLKFTT